MNKAVEAADDYVRARRPDWFMRAHLSDEDFRGEAHVIALELAADECRLAPTAPINPYAYIYHRVEKLLPKRMWRKLHTDRDDPLVGALPLDFSDADRTFLRTATF